MKKFISLLMVFAVLLASSVLIYPDSPLANFALKANAEASSGTCGENLTWTFNESTGELIISGTGEMWEEPNWPYGLKFVKISDGVTSIGKRAFYNSGIESVTISDSVTSIEYGAFYKCKNLTSVTIPGSVTNIGLQAFSLCQNLTRITVESSNTAYSSDEDGVLFNKSKSELIHYPAKNIKTSYIIPNGVTIIGGGAFIECQNLINVTIPDSVTSIGDNAFIQCFNLKSVIIPDSVTSTGIGTFYACPAMEYIHISSSVTTIDNIILSDADKAKGIESIKTDLENATEEELEEYAKQGVTKETVANWKPTTLICSDSEDSAAKTFAEQNGNEFAVCDGHDTPEILGGQCGDNLTWTFDESTGELVISGTGVMTDWLSYSDVPWHDKCSSIKTVTLENGVTSIGNYAFYDCGGITSATIPDSVTSIGNYAFYDCGGITSVTIPDSVTSIGNRAFSNCYGLTSIEIPDSVISIGNYAFHFCYNLTSIEIPDSATIIGEQAFYVCCGLEYIHIPLTVTSIGNKTIASDSEKAESVENAKTMLENATEEELAEYAKLGVTKEVVATWKPTTLICSDGEDSAAKTFAEQNGNKFRVCDGHDDEDVPEEPTIKPEEPTTKPTEPVTKPEETEPSTTKPTEVPATRPEEPTTKPVVTEPSTTRPEEPTTQPEEPTTKPEVPTTKPEEPTTKPSVPDEPEADEDVIPQPKVSEISYGDKIVLSVDPAKIPKGGRVEWNANNNHFDYTVGDDFSCTIDPVSSGETTFTATVYDADGNAVSTDEQTLTAKAGFFQKIIGFFKKLFNLTKVYTNI